MRKLLKKTCLRCGHDPKRTAPMTQTTTTKPALMRALRAAHVPADEIRSGWISIIRAIDDIDTAAALADAYPDVWPSCCCSRGCAEPATTIESDGGDLSCAPCTEYTCCDDGDILCGSCDADQVETVTESCGAGSQMRSYLRQRPPAMPPADPDGAYGVWWETVGDDAHLVSRHASYDDAIQAVRAHDWPAPGDRTAYLCGFGVRQIIDGKWCAVEEADDDGR